jgi:hypothetical protein
MLSIATRRLPRIRGLGRCILTLDRCLTNPHSAASYEAIADLSDGTRLKVDLRVLEQKFAFYHGRWERDLISAVKRHYQRGIFYDIGGSIGLYAVTIFPSRVNDLRNPRKCKSCRPVLWQHQSDNS